MSRKSTYRTVQISGASSLHPALAGFGVAANYTSLDSSLAGESRLGIHASFPTMYELSGRRLSLELRAEF